MELAVEDGLDAEVLNREAGFGAGSDFVFAHGDPDGLNAALRHLLLWCWRCQLLGEATGRAVDLHPAVRRALELLGEGAWGEDLATLARRCGVSEAYLSRVFKRQVGVSLTRYRNSTRLGQFLELRRAAEGRKTLMELALAAGFGSYAQFFKVFVEAFGHGPREAGGAGR
jgi:methylphosphotriester-DNA--protein-cysteine methyltransferase